MLKNLRSKFTKAINDFSDYKDRHPVKAGLKALGTIFAVHAAIGIPTSFILPDAEDYLREKGINPLIIQDIAPDTNIKIQPRSFPYGLRLAFQLPQAYMRKSFAGAWTGLLDEYKLFNQCVVVLPSDSATARDFISNLTKIPEEMIENIPLTNEEMFIAVLLHEFRHCDDRNNPNPVWDKLVRIGSLGMYMDPARSFLEADSDMNGFFKANKLFKKPEIIKTALYMRALMPKKHVTHDTSLYLDTLIRGQSLPEWKEVQKATEEAFDLMEKYQDDSNEEEFVKNTRAFRKVLNLHGKTMSPNAKRRATLYIEAAEYFAPSAVKQQPDPITTYKPSV